MTNDALTKEDILYTAPIMTNGNNYERNFVSKKIYNQCKTSQDEPLIKLRKVVSAVKMLKEKIKHTYGCESWMKQGMECRCDYSERINQIDECFPAFKEEKKP